MKGLTFIADPQRTIIAIHNETGLKTESFNAQTYPHKIAWQKLICYLRSIGFIVEQDKKVGKCIRKYYIRGRKGALEFRGEIFPAGAAIKFFQNVVFENKNGGEYDFDKYEKMPYLIRLQLINTCNKVTDFLKKEELSYKQIYRPKTAEDMIKSHYVEEWHHPQKDMDFTLSDLDGTTCEGSYNNTDREKKTIHNGEIKYFRDYDGYLKRGRVYHNINNMWWVILNDSKITNIADFNLFDLNDNEPKGRIKQHRPSKKYIEKVEIFKSLSDKELLAEIKRRKRKKTQRRMD